jgi:hypothetical protein
VIGCYEGLFQANNQGDSLYFCRWTHDPENPNSLSHNHIWSLFESPLFSSRDFWIGTYLGFNFFEVKNEKFIHYIPDPAEIMITQKYFSLLNHKINGNFQLIYYFNNEHIIYLIQLGKIWVIDKKQVRFLETNLVRSEFSLDIH